MGLDVNGVRLTLLAKRLGADFKDVVTIGRQGLHLTSAQLEKELSKSDIPRPVHWESADKRYSESLFSLLGAQTIQSIDNSDYENATIVHDMNEPLPAQFKGQFSLVIDAGTLEHVFNYPVALKNCMELLRSGGFFVSITPANNFMGHGFYQFSPELFFSVFKPENGFQLMKLLICEDFDDAQWYEVSSPRGGVHGRVTLNNHHPTYLMCIARRVDEKCEPFKATPQQSDYVEAWDRSSLQDEDKKPKKPEASGPFRRLKGLVKSIPLMKYVIRNIRYIRKPAFSRPNYTPINPVK